MALRAGFHWLASDSIRLVLLALVSKQHTPGVGSTTDDHRVHGDGGCDHLGAN